MAKFCPKCGNGLRYDMFCETCKEYSSDINKSEKENKPEEENKSQMSLKWLIVILCIFFICISSAILIPKYIENKKAANEYNKIYDYFVYNKDYEQVLINLKEFKTKYSKNKKMMVKASDLVDNVELALYERTKSEYKTAIPACDTYLEYFTDGQYVEDVKKSLIEASDKKAVDDINKAKAAIQKNDISSADTILQSVVDDIYVSKKIKEQANDILNSKIIKTNRANQYI